MTRYTFTYSLAAVLIFTFSLIGGCSGLTDASSTTDSMVGEITRIEFREDFGLRILVEENTNVQEPMEDGGKKTWYAISEESELFQIGRKSAYLHEIDAGHLESGQIVKAWSTGVHMLSYPSQTGAKRVIVLK